MSGPSPAGFDWRKANEWRSHPLLTNHKLSHMLPGLGLGVAAFAGYCAAELAYKIAFPPAKPAHGSGH